MRALRLRSITTFLFAGLAPFLLPAAMAQKSDVTAAALRARIHELEEAQQQLDTAMRKRMASAGMSNEEIARAMAIIEKDKLKAHQGRTVYFYRRSDGTPRMQNYYEHVVSRIAQCGTRHSPKTRWKKSLRQWSSSSVVGPMGEMQSA